MKTVVSKIDCSKHKAKGTCNVQGCHGRRASKGICKKCKKRRYRSYCRSHYADGTKRPRLRGKATTKSVRKRRNLIKEKKGIVIHPQKIDN